MTESANLNDRRPQRVSLLGLLLQILCCAGLWVLAVSFQSETIKVVARLFIIGIPVWLVLYLVFRQMVRVSAEALETAELKRAQESGEADALFEFDDEALLLEQSRLRWMIKWILPATTIIAAAVLLLGQLIGWNWTFENAFGQDVIAPTREPFMLMWFLAAAGGLCFFFGYYAIALARIPEWRVIRAGATIMKGNAIACLIAALAMAASSVEWSEPVAAYVLRAFLMLLGIEFAMNFILDLYRPRVPGEIPRPSFDSRVLGLITEPGGIAKSLADAVNYQFGFEVSATWFYQLLQRWMLPIFVLSGIAIFLLTSIVIVDPHEQVVIERFGRRVGGDNAELDPGIYLKWPFPVDVVYRAPVRRVDELVIGEATEDEHDHAGKANVWTEKHEFVPELMLLVASRQDETEQGRVVDKGSEDGESESAPMSLLMVSVPIEYRIKNIHDYLYRYDEPDKLLEVEAYRFLSNYAAGVDIRELMGPGRESFNDEFRTELQARLDDLQVGIEVVFAGVADAHPPAQDNVAATFQSVIQSEIQKGADLNRAEGLAKRMLVDVAGSVARARELDEAIIQLNKLKKDPNADSDALATAGERVTDLLLGNFEKGVSAPGGATAAFISGARVKASRAISEAANKARAFSTEVVAFEASPELYRHRKQLEVYENLGRIRRYLIAGDPQNVIITYTTERAAELDKVLADDSQQ
ncbi:MAG: SPFH domain-containing protein [Planctomycetota bacterium]|jgi:regulator of protease activity HflC (stomatin/prohibitin superfamily)